MNIIKCVAWKNCENLWTQWINNEETQAIQRLNTSLLYIDYDCIKGKTPKRTIGYVKETPGDETTSMNIIGCVIVHSKEISGLRIGCIDHLGVDPKYRRNNVASQLLDVCLTYMFQAQFDISVAHTSIVPLFEKFGFVSLPHKNINGDIMMYRPLKGLPIGYSIDSLISFSKRLGG